MRQEKVLNRATQYHLAHSTKVAGFSCIYGGDDRFYNNIFVGVPGVAGVGTSHYNGCGTSLEEYIEEVHKIHGDHEAFNRVEQPVYIKNNAYLNGAEAFEREESKFVDASFNPNVEIHVEGEEVYLSLELPDSFSTLSGEVHSTATLPRVRIVDAEFEKPDGSELVLDYDYLDNKINTASVPGPIASLKAGKNYIKVW